MLFTIKPLSSHGEVYAPYLLEGGTEEDVLSLLATWMGDEGFDRLQQSLPAESLLLLALDSLVCPGPVPGVTPVLSRFSDGDWQLGLEDELGPIFTCARAGEAVRQALAWMGWGEEIAPG